MDGSGLLRHELLEGLDEGVELLPASLVWAMVHLREAVGRWQAVIEGPVGPELALSHAVAEVRPKLKNIRAMVRRLSRAWDCPRFILGQWEDLQDWLLEGEEGPCQQLEKLDELVEEVAGLRSTEELDDEWLEENIATRCFYLGEDCWDQFTRLVKAVGLAGARQAHREQRLATEARNTQEAINARLAMSLSYRNRPC